MVRNIRSTSVIQIFSKYSKLFIKCQYYCVQLYEIMVFRMMLYILAFYKFFIWNFLIYIIKYSWKIESFALGLGFSED